MAILALSTLMTVTLATVEPERPARQVARMPEISQEFLVPDRVIVKFVETTRVRLVDDRWADLSGASLSAYEAVLDGAPYERLFTRSVQSLDEERAMLFERVPSQMALPADLNNYYVVHTSGAERSVELVRELNAMPLVEIAYQALIPIALGNDIDPPTPNFEIEQDFKGPSPLGLAYDSMRNIVGATGPDLIVGHLEGSWHFGPEDACQIITSNVVGALPGPGWDGWRNHGDAVAGVLTCDRNGYGMRGMNHDAQLILSSLENGAANMISLCTAVADAGDVFVSSFAWVVDGLHAPVDWPQAEFDAVNAAAIKGIVYCFGAGNTDHDLGDQSAYGDRYTPGAPDSGGVIVGAGNSTDSDKIGFSNFGQRVDCRAWGEDIGTIGYGDLFGPDSQQLYTDTFGGTSGAGPLVAGIAASISNIVREQNDQQLTAFEIRDLLRTIGTPQGSGGHVGLQPDLEAILASLSLPEGLNLQGDGQIGQNVSLDVQGTPSMPFLVLASANRGRASVGLNRDLLIDATSMVLITGLTLDGSGQATVTGMIPNDPSLHDLSVYFQVLDMINATTLHLTNSIELWIR